MILCNVICQPVGKLTFVSTCLFYRCKLIVVINSAHFFLLTANTMVICHLSFMPAISTLSALFFHSPWTDWYICIIYFISLYEIYSSRWESSASIAWGKTQCYVYHRTLTRSCILSLSVLLYFTLKRCVNRRYSFEI